MSRGQNQPILNVEVQNKAAQSGRRILMPTPCASGHAVTRILRRLEAENIRLREQVVDLAIEIQTLRNIGP